jgi:hypothetical protein
MHVIDMNNDTSGHKWSKVNQVTLKDQKSTYDLMQCDSCQLKGKRRSFTEIQIPSTHGYNKVFNCPASNSADVKRVRIKKVNGGPGLFDNLTPGSEHDTVPVPEHQKHKNLSGVWVMGVGEPVRILPTEYEIIKD